MITILDYGEGNIQSNVQAFQYLGHKTQVTSSTTDIDAATVLVVPGQGAFRQVMQSLATKGLINPIKTYIQSGRKYLGLCLGFQILFESSDEHGDTDGLGIFHGSIRRLKGEGVKIPHMGWNDCEIKNDEMFAGIQHDKTMYFVHSYALFKTDQAIVASETTHGERFVSAVKKDNIWATQFHPEKSGANGLQLLRNFLAS